MEGRHFKYGLGEQSPPYTLPSTFHSLSSFPSLLPSTPLPSPLPLEVGPLITAGGLGERFSFLSGSGRSPAAKRYLVNFRLKNLASGGLDLLEMVTYFCANNLFSHNNGMEDVL